MALQPVAGGRPVSAPEVETTTLSIKETPRTQTTPVVLPQSAAPVDARAFKNPSAYGLAQALIPAVPTMPPVAPAADPKANLYADIQKILGDDLFSGFKAYAESKNVTPAQLSDYKSALQLIIKQLGENRFQKLLHEPFNDQDNIFYDPDGVDRLYPGAPKKDFDAFYGFILDQGVSVENYVNAIWSHGNDYGGDKIGAPYVTCSKVEKKISPNRVIQQVVLDLPFPITNKMTLNDTTKKTFGGLGVEISWKLSDEKGVHWACLDTENTDKEDFSSNNGSWKILPLAENKVLVWYATQSSVNGFDPTDGQANDALKDNMEAFSKAAHGSYGK